jgi:hypothetical protein
MAPDGKHLFVVQGVMAEYSQNPTLRAKMLAGILERSIHLHVGKTAFIILWVLCLIVSCMLGPSKEDYTVRWVFRDMFLLLTGSLGTILGVNPTIEPPGQSNIESKAVRIIAHDTVYAKRP